MKIFRTNIWWNAIVPQVLGWVYFCMLYENFDLTTHYLKFGFFFISLIGISAFGYVLNDWSDIKTDLISGKVSHISKLSMPMRILLLLFPLGVGVASWILSEPPVWGTAFFILQITSLSLYSLPPIRLKSRGTTGVLTDAFYGHINPVIITLIMFNFRHEQGKANVLLFGLIFICTALKGICNILLHQISDRKKDRLAGIGTFVVKYGGLFSLNFTNGLIAIETIFTFLLAGAISYFIPPFLLSFLLFSVITYLKFSGWKLAYLPKKQLKFKFLYFLNDYYEGWIPVFFLILLSIRQHQFVFLLALHLVLFPTFLTKLWNDLFTIKQNLKTEDDY